MIKVVTTQILTTSMLPKRLDDGISDDDEDYNNYDDENDDDRHHHKSGSGHDDDDDDDGRTVWPAPLPVTCETSRPPFPSSHPHSSTAQLQNLPTIPNQHPHSSTARTFQHTSNDFNDWSRKKGYFDFLQIPIK